MKKFVFPLMLTLLLSSCQVVGGSSSSSSESSNIPASETSSEQISEESSEASSEETSSEDINKYLDDLETINFMYFPDFKMTVGQKLYIDNYVIENDDTEILVRDENIVSYSKKYLYAHKEGTTYLIVKVPDGDTFKYQRVNIEVLSDGDLTSTWNFNDMKKGQKIVSFGDSVTANETIGADLTYVRKIANQYGLEFVKNYAIGGTTATYMYEGSNIYKEYKGNTTAIDGPRVVKRAYDNGELNDIDYAFIAYGHNDHYFQPPITVEGDDVYNVDNFDNAHSFKGSYRYMVNLLRKANPNIKIILLNCTYSRYNYDGSVYGHTYTYHDYRHAITELAMELDCKTVDPWNYLENFYDGETRNAYYKDVVHLSVKGHEKLYSYIVKF